MKYLRTLLLFLVIVVCGGFLIYYAQDIRTAMERLPISRVREGEPQHGKLLDLDPATIERVSIIANGTDTVEAVVIPIAFWKIEKPVDWAGDRRVWTRILTAIRDAQISRAWPVSPDSLAPYGLDPPATRVVLQFQGNAMPAETLDVGMVTPADQNCYVRHLPSDSVYTVQQALKAAVAKSLLDLRDKAVLPFQVESVARIMFNRRGGRIVMDRQANGEWTISSPSQGLAAADTVNSLLRAVSQVSATRFHDDPGDLAQYGLRPPQSEITFVIDVGGTAIEKRLLIGNRMEAAYQGMEPSMYVMDGSKNSVVEVSALLQRHTHRSIDGFRNRLLNQFARAHANRVRITTPQRTIVVVQDTLAHEWYFAAPDTGQVHRPVINRVVADVDNLRGGEIIDRPGDYGLSHPQVRIELFRGDRAVARLALGSRRGNQVYARGMYTDQVFLVDAGIIDRLTPSTDELRAPTMPANPAAAAVRVPSN